MECKRRWEWTQPETLSFYNLVPPWECISAWLYGVHRTRRDGSSFTWHQPCQRCKHNTLIDIQKRAIKKLFTHAESHVSAASLLKSGEQRYIKAIINNNNNMGAGIAQWLERRTRDWKVAGSNPCWNGGRIFFSRVDFLCWLLFRYPFHPRVTTV